MKKAKQPSSMAADIMGVIRDGTKKWTRTRKAEERSPASRSYRYARMTRERGISIKEAAAEIMEEAYMKVSGNDTLPANARQIMYAARPHIQKATGKPLDDHYFTQILLPDYVDEHGVDCNVVLMRADTLPSRTKVSTLVSALWKCVAISMTITTLKLLMRNSSTRTSRRAAQTGILAGYCL